MLDEKVTLNKHEVDRVFRHVFSCPRVTRVIKRYASCCIMYPLCKKGCCDKCDNQKCRRRCIRNIVDFKNGESRI